jgi:hypothetical protein
MVGVLATRRQDDMKAEVGRQRLKSAERMRRHRERKRDGYFCLRIDVHRECVDALVRRRWLRAEDRENSQAVGDAICRVLDAALP